jgi:hypothetical protein
MTIRLRYAIPLILMICMASCVIEPCDDSSGHSCTQEERR